MSAPAGYTPLPTGEYMKDSDSSGPYVYDGTTMLLKGTGAAPGAGGEAVTVADGADVTQGAIADAAVAAGAAGTISAKARRLTTDLAAMSVKLPATLGAKTSALSLSMAPSTDYALPASTNVSSTAYEKSHVLAAAPARLFSLQGYNSGVDQFIQLHDSATLPVDTAVPVVIIFVRSQDSFSWDFGQRGRSFAAGITVCNSSTGPTKTLGATADCWFDAQTL